MSRSATPSRFSEWPLPPDPGESRLLLDLFPDPLIVARGPARKLLSVNRAFMELIGVDDHGELRDVPLTHWIHEDDRHRLRRHTVLALVPADVADDLARQGSEAPGSNGVQQEV